MIKAEFHSFFSLFSEPQQQQLLAATEHCLYKHGNLIFDEGDESDALYLVLEGEVELRKRTTAGDVEILARLRGDECFGEMGVLDGCERSASAYAVTDTRLAYIPGNLVLQALEHEPSVTLIRMFRSVSDRLRRTDADYVSETFRRSRSRQIRELASSLLRSFEGPVRTIEMLGQDDVSDSSPRDVAQAAIKQAHRMQRNAMMLASFGKEYLPVNIQSGTLSDLLGEFAKHNVAWLSSRSIELEYEAGDEPIEVDCDGVFDVLQMLVNNAVEAGAGNISIGTYWQPSSIEFTITDDGNGVPERIRDTLFAPFITDGKPGALGLGLAIAKSIVTAHEGHIRYLPGESGGSTFTIYIPNRSKA